MGQGDAILLVRGETVALIDGGESGSGILPYLQGHGITHLDLVIATHPHSDHIGGLVDVLQALPVDLVVTNGQPTTTGIYEQFLDAIASAGAEYMEARQGDAIPFADLTLSVLNPLEPAGDNLNNQSLVLRLVDGQVSFLFMGDAELEAEQSIMASGADVRATVLKVAHHASRSSSSSAFLARVQPQVAVYCAGAGNSFGHPHAETLTALAGVGAKVYGTDVNGTVIVTSDGLGYRVEVERQGEPRAPPAPETAVATEPPATPEPTTAPQPTAPVEAATATPPPAAEALAIEVVSLTSPVGAGSNASLTIKTAPGAACTITVYYKSGPSEAQGLGPQNADGNGSATWSWKVGTRTTPGVWRIVVTAATGGQQATLEIPFEVR